MDFFMPENMRGSDTMPYFCDGKLGVYERMMTQKPGYHRRSGKSGRDIPPKKPLPKKTVENNAKKGKDDNRDG